MFILAKTETANIVLPNDQEVFVCCSHSLQISQPQSPSGAGFVRRLEREPGQDLVPEQARQGQEGEGAILVSVGL